MDTPHTYILHLISYVTDDSMIASQCNSNFGTKVTARRVSEIRHSLPKAKQRNVEPLWDNKQAQWERSAKLSNKAFLKALAQ